MRNIKNRKYLLWLFVFVFVISLVCGGTSADLNYGNADSRTSKEQNDATARPEITGELPVLDGYENVYIGCAEWSG